METWMAWIIVIIVGAIVIGTLLWLKKRNGLKSEVKANIPPEIMQGFIEAETELKRRADNNENIDPYEIMWQLANKKRLQGGTNNGKTNTATEEAIPADTSATASPETDVRAITGSDSPVVSAEPGVPNPGSDEVGGPVQDRSSEEPKPNSSSTGKGFLRRGRRSKQSTGG